MALKTFCHSQYLQFRLALTIQYVFILMWPHTIYTAKVPSYTLLECSLVLGAQALTSALIRAASVGDCAANSGRPFFFHYHCTQCNYQDVWCHICVTNRQRVTGDGSLFGWGHREEVVLSGFLFLFRSSCTFNSILQKLNQTVCVFIRQWRAAWNTCLCFCSTTCRPHLSMLLHFTVMPGWNGSAKYPGVRLHTKMLMCVRVFAVSVCFCLARADISHECRLLKGVCCFAGIWWPHSTLFNSFRRFMWTVHRAE